jgi:hypothetical protein
VHADKTQRSKERPLENSHGVWRELKEKEVTTDTELTGLFVSDRGHDYR